MTRWANCRHPPKFGGVLLKRDFRQLQYYAHHITISARANGTCAHCCDHDRPHRGEGSFKLRAKRRINRISPSQFANFCRFKRKLSTYLRGYRPVLCRDPRDASVRNSAHYGELKNASKSGNSGVVRGRAFDARLMRLRRKTLATSYSAAPLAPSSAARSAEVTAPQSVGFSGRQRGA